MRVIKKYPNRRLYDTGISTYITLGEIRQLILDGEDFVVQDARSGEDLTRAVLLQLIGEYEDKGQPVFTTSSLKQVIRLYGDPLQALIGSYLEQSLTAFSEQQHALRRQFASFVGPTPVKLMGELAERQFELWRSLLSGTKPPRSD